MHSKSVLSKNQSSSLRVHNGTGKPLSPHAHPELEANLVISGSARYLLSGRKWVELNARSVIWLFPKQEHVLIKRSANFSMWVIVWKNSIVKRICNSQGNRLLQSQSPPPNFVRSLKREHFQDLHKLCTDISKNSDEKSFFKCGMDFLLLKTWQKFQHAAPIHLKDDLHPAVEKTIHLLQKDIPAAALPTLGKTVGLSPGRLSRLFKKQTSTTITQYRQQIQIDRFKEIYGTGQRFNMTEAALAAGFGSYPQFHRVFKSVTNSSPAEYRKSMS